MKKNTLQSYSLLAILLVVFSVIAFLVPFERNTLFWLGYGFGVFAILYQLYVIRLSTIVDGGARSRFYGFPILRIGMYYLVAQLIISIAEMALAVVIPIRVALIVNILLAAIAVFGCITTGAVRDEVVRQDDQMKNTVTNMRELQSLSRSLVSQCKNAELRPILENLAEEFRFSDPVSSTETSVIEAEMRSQLGNIRRAISDENIEGVKNLCSKLLGTLSERNRLCSMSK